MPFRRLQRWYSAQCDGQWEHGPGISITTLDNPGWKLRICLLGTSLENQRMDKVTFSSFQDGWITYWIEHQTFHAIGDPLQLETMIERFLEIAEGTA